MNLIATAPWWLAALLLVCLAAAAIEDFRRLRISNLTGAAVLAGALAAMAIAGLSLDLWQNFAVFVALLVLGTIAFGAGLMGGGDVKLLAALGLWVDLRGGVWLITAVFLAGGILALAYVLARRVRRSPRASAPAIPYGVAIAAGAAILMGLQRPELKSSDEPALPPLKIVPPA